MSDSKHSHGFKGIKVNISADGQMDYAAEKIPFKPFEELTWLLDGPINAEVMAKMEAIVDQLPDPRRPETWIRADGLNVLRRFWAAQEAYDEHRQV
jgi:hypothetical protein